MYCFKCGAKVPDGAKFCSSCGAQLIDDPSAKEPTIPEEIRSEPSVAPDSKMTQVEEVSEDTKVQGTSEGLPILLVRVPNHTDQNGISPKYDLR